MIDLTAQIARQQRAASRRVGVELAIEGVRSELDMLADTLRQCEAANTPTVRLRDAKHGWQELDREQVIAGVKDGMAKLRAQLVRLEARQLARGATAS